jgi:hypothetical protein
MKFNSEMEMGDFIEQNWKDIDQISTEEGIWNTARYTLVDAGYHLIILKQRPVGDQVIGLSREAIDIESIISIRLKPEEKCDGS